MLGSTHYEYLSCWYIEQSNYLSGFPLANKLDPDQAAQRRAV